ncbi:uncharacterized protein LOC128550221 isoform X2 [Mercenaria mercenaria]|uniref:uncharacterized protein LOC128550221 isoform X2 n=1 Tax=Mercenaria mercenaria TaxID=6596 RepID=UPI00234F2E31|nr:uncharacterized protein LOC128550221 isoform X2 [Mercenaria mercenaria]
MSKKHKHTVCCLFSNAVGQTPVRSMEQLISVGQVDSSDRLGTALHHSAYVGNKRTLKKVLQQGIHVDYPNDEGQTPLFCACLGGNESVVEYLLSAGADPNEKTNQGQTPLHSACYSGSIKILLKLLKEGGDMRLHDYHGRSVKDWAMLNPIPKKRMKILEFLDKTRMFAMSGSGQDLLLKKASFKTLHRAHHRRNSVTKIIRDRIGRPSVHADLERMATSRHSVGFGHVYSNGSDKTGFMSAIPLVSENNLKHDPAGETYNNGAFCVMESAWWDYSQVTVKTLHRDVDPYQGGVVDLLINEVEHIGKLRHPNILTLMGVCQTSNLDGMILIYERIVGGSLYNYLHQKMMRLHTQMIDDIALQICNAIIFIHLQGLVHCSITSHAISVINSHTFKLGSFEYMIEASKCDWGKKSAVASNTEENAVYNWMAPEIMFNMPPSFYCDMFSFCAVLWEIFHGEVPWDSQCSESIKDHYSKGEGLKIANGKVPEYYRIILDYGLRLDPTHRQLSFLHVRDLLQAAPKDAKNFVRAHFQHLHPHDDEGGSQSRSGSRLDSAKKPHPPQADNQPGTSRNVDNDIEDRQRRRDRDRKRHDIDNKEFNTEMDTGYKIGTSPEMKMKKRVEGVNSRRNNRLVEQYPTKVRLSWDSLSKDTGEEFRYFVGLSREESSVKSSDPQGHSEHGNKKSDNTRKQLCYPVYEDNTDTKATGDDKSKEREKIESESSSEYAVGRELERKTSSMGNFSYLALGAHQRTKSTGAKPACHGTYEAVSEEYTTSGKLTTAGSLYSLYNEHSPNHPLGQIEKRRGNIKYVTLPRRKQPSAPLFEPDPSWFGGRGSVRNLAQQFQEQIQEHNYYQAVLDGTVNRELSSEKICEAADYGNHAKVNGVTTKPTHTTPGSMESVSTDITATDNETSNIHQIAFDVDDETDSAKSTKSSSSFTTGASTDSQAVSNWVDHELRKIKRKISEEIMSKHSLASVHSPDLFDECDNHGQAQSGPLLQKDSGDGIGCFSSSDCSEVTPITSETSVTFSEQESGDHVKCGQVEEFYYDDELYQTSRPVAHTTNKSSPWSSYQQKAVHASPTHLSSRHCTQEDRKGLNKLPASRSVKSNLPMRSVMKETGSPSKKGKPVISSRADENKKRMSRIPTSRSKLTSFKSNSSEGAFANIMTVRSSLQEVGKHQVTHKVKNLKTGGSNTMLNRLVNGQKITTTFKALA